MPEVVERFLSEVAWFQEGPGILAKDFRPSGIPLVRLAGLGGHEVSLDGCNFVSPEMGEGKWSHFRLSEGDICISTSATFGRPATVRGKAAGAIFYTGIIRFRSTSDDLDTRYLRLFLGSRAFANQAEAMASGSVIRHFGPSHLKQMRIQLPSRRVQSRIAALVDALDDKIELNRRMNETLEAMAQAIFRDWFVDFGPTRRKLAGIADPTEIMGGLVRDPVRAASLAALFPAALGDDGLPVGWEMGTLAGVAKLNPETWSARNHPSEVEYVDLSNTKWGTIEATTMYAWEDSPSRARRVARRGDTMVGTVRPGNGSYAYIGRNGLTGSTGFAVLRPLGPQLSPLVYCAATRRENIDRLATLADGGAYPAVRPDLVLATDVVGSKSQAGEFFGELCGPLIGKIEANKEENQTLAATRDLLLPKLMSGEIRLREAEAIAEEAS
ncbi:MAG: restriction endonuclease subunit S [Hyphomicrobiaceae bacterium]